MSHHLEQVESVRLRLEWRSSRPTCSLATRLAAHPHAMASYFKVACPGCNKTLKVSDKLAGKSRACPYCCATVRIPESAPEEPENVFPNIQIATKPAKAKRPASSRETPESSAPVGGPGPDEAANARTKPEEVRRPKARKSWFRSSSDSASSDVSLPLSGLMGALMTLVWYGATFPIRNTHFGALFWDRGPVPLPTTFLMFWAVSILILKWLRLKQQKNAMLLDVLPTEVSEEITLDSLDGFIEHINQLPGASSDSFLINRVVRGIEHFRVRKSAAETVTMMESQSAIDANNVAGSYTILKVFIWSLPILGFIGTVMGVSSAVASLASSLSDGGQHGGDEGGVARRLRGPWDRIRHDVAGFDHEHAGQDSRFGHAEGRGGL